jgi:hypothetical protein
MMTALPEGLLRTEALHAARSRVIDAFGEAEGALVALLRDRDAKLLTAPLGQKMAAVRKLAPSPQYSKSRRDAVHLALDKLLDLLPRRAEIAHSQMRFVRIVGDSEERAAFHNPGTQPGLGEAIVVYSRQDLIDLATSVREIALALASRI